MATRLNEVGAGLLVLLVLFWAGCRQKEPAERGEWTATLNPVPQQPVEFTLKIDDPPGPFALVKGSVQYDVVNADECGFIHPFAGTPVDMSHREGVSLTRMSDSEYRGTVYLDLLQDEDFFQRGICRWQLTAASARLKATGRQEETRFLLTMNRERLLSGAPEVRFYTDAWYPKADLDNFPDFGAADPERFRPEYQKDVFTISMVAEGRRP